ncbi:MAG: glycoside hydrolase family 99-like domain-containing protein [Eudoraea sp.]|nr:glycoside hydrolase family 99-like domain-containing protein [Eudoraea sp.]
MKRFVHLIISLLVMLGCYGCDNTKNTSPKIIEVVPELAETVVGKMVTFRSVVTDEDPSGLTYQWQCTCGSFHGEARNQSVDWKAPDEPGACEISVTVSDGEYTDNYVFTVEVKDPGEGDGPTIGVYYYPWHGSGDFHGRNYLREHLVPVQAPELGEYNDRDHAVIAQHLDWSEYAGIDLWVSSWWGPEDLTDITLKDYILQHSDLDQMKIALFYETTARIPGFSDLSNVRSDIEYMAEHYFKHPNYYTIDGKPVLFIYLTRVLSSQGTLENTLEIMRDEAENAGLELYIVGDQVFGQPPSFTGHIALLDAVTNYDVYGSTGANMYATQGRVDSYYQAQEGWRDKAHEVGVSFIPATSPGFNDTGVRDGHIPLSRKLTENDEFGSLFQAMVNKAITLVDQGSYNLFMVTSWNEWHEDTQIEPVSLAPPTSTDDSGSQQDYTAGMEYEGYGKRYLDILKASVGK